MSASSSPVIGQVISFLGEDDPVRATAAHLSSSALTGAHLLAADAPLALGSATVGVAPVLVLALAAGVSGPGSSSVDVVRATSMVAPGLAVWDGTELRHLVLGANARPPESLDLRLLGVVVDKEREQIATSCGAATLGHPAVAVAALANAGEGQRLRAGWMIAAGPLTPLAPLAPGECLTATFAHLGSVSVATEA